MPSQIAANSFSDTSFFQRIKNQRKLGYYITGILALVFLVWLIIVPLVFVLSRSFVDNDTGAITGTNWANNFSGDNQVAVLNSLVLATLVTLLSSALALPLSYFLSKTRLRKAWWLGILMMIPFMIPPYINSMGWMYFMLPNSSILWNLSDFFHPLCNSFYSLWGMVWIMSMHTFPFLTTMLNSALDSFPSNLEDAVKVYSPNRFKTFFHVYVPILLPNYLIGAFLVFVKALSEYGTPATFGTRINYPVFTTLITDYMQVAPINFPMASSLASLLILICLVIWVLETWVVRKNSFALMPSAQPKINTSTASFVIGIIFCVLLFFFSTFIPLFSLIITSFKVKTGHPLSEEGNFTLENYEIAFNENEGFGTGWQALGNTFFISILSALIVLLFGLLFGIYCRRYRNRLFGKGVELIATLPQMLPNIVTAIGLIFLYNAIYKAIPIYRTPGMLIVGYTVILLPGMFSYVKNSLTQMPESLLEAGELFSRNKFMTDVRIVLPQAIKGSVYGFIMTMIVAFRELVTAKLLQPPSFYTLSLYIDFQFEQGNPKAAVCLAVVSVGITLLILLPLEFLTKGRKKKGA